MSKHTPGPWKYNSKLSGSENHRGFYITANRGMTIGELHPLDPDGDEGKANARLISAAPDLLESLKAILACDGSRGIYDATKHIKEIQLAEIAIKKAEGKEA
jgi:hypothetical protein